MAATTTSTPPSGEQHGCVRDAARGYMRAVLGVIESSPLGVAIDVFGDLRGMIDAAEARRLAAEVSVDGDARQAQRKVAASGRVSKRESRRRAAAAAAVKKNSTLGDMVDDGSMTSEQLDTIAAAMRTDESAATDQELIDAVAGAPVDQGRKIGRDWAARMTDADKAQSEHDRQRAARRAAHYFDKTTQLSAIKLEGDSAGLYQLWQGIEAEERRLWRMDGGRDVPESKHRRTRDQRLFDAAVSLLTSAGGGGGGGGGGASSLGVPAAVLNIHAGKLGDATDQCVDLVGHGPIADSFAAELVAKANLTINVTGLDGQTLWWGRTKRHAPTQLRIALALRDKGCVRCGQDWQKCQAHHLMPWNAPGKGETNLEDLALMCESCHHHLHDMGLTLFRKPDGTWATRPATPNETPPRRPATKHRPKSDRRAATKPTSPAATERPKPNRPKPKKPNRASRDGDPAANPPAHR